MSASVPETPRPRSAPSPASTAPPRRRPPFSPLSALSSAGGEPSPVHSFRSASLRSPESVSGASRYTRTFSAAASQAGSLATTTASPAGPARFKRGHVRKKPGQQLAPPPVRTANPDEVDLMALEEPDEVFRLFGVRDVRRIEQRASDAAAAKVAELRTMVGERYRDLLAAADSIVRMRSAAEKLVDRLDSVEAAVSDAGAAVEGTPSKRGKAIQAATRRANSPSRQRTLASSATLSLTIHLLLLIPSLAHSLLERSDFLPAARLDDLGRLVYRQLSEFELPPEHEDDEPRRLLEAFPIVEKQWETLSTLRPVVLRRALADLENWDAKPLRAAKTLAAVVMLKGSTLGSALSTFLESRSRALSAILLAPSTSSKSLDTSVVVERLQQVLGLILRTVEAVSAIFGDDTSSGLLQQLLVELERPSSGSVEAHETALSPVLATFPNYSTLQRHLPQSILSYCPPLASSSAQRSLAASAVSQQLESWLSGETDRVVNGVTSWISALSTPVSPGTFAHTSPAFGAKPLAYLRHSLRLTLSTATPASASTASFLSSRLERVLESRLAAVYRARLDALVARVHPALEALLLALLASATGAGSKGADADRDTARFWFDEALAFPSAQAYAPPASARLALPGGGSSGGATEQAAAADPFEGFLARVGKRVEGRTPLIDRGLSELEDAAREIRADLESWVGEDDAAEERREGDEALKERLRREYFEAARETLGKVADALEGVLNEVASDVDNSLFVGNFVFLLSASRPFTRDLLLGSPESSNVADWQSRLAQLQARSPDAWRKQACENAVNKLRESLSIAAATSPSATLWAWDASRHNGQPDQPLVPSSPSSALLSALRSLSSSVTRVGLHRTQSDPSIASSLLGAFAADVRDLAVTFADALERGELQQSEARRAEVAAQAAWDLALLRRLVLPADETGSKAASTWRELERRFFALVSSASGTLESQIANSTLLYLQRSQSILAPLLPHPPTFYASGAPSAPAAAETTLAPATRSKPLSSASRLLPLGQPVTGLDRAAGAASDLRSTSIGLVKPGPRLGLLPTRG
ncbi:uncharacterized protein JCM10292_007502 [Rhodotorula paludigena]|uniref:uncharacterized protein n=1 Tax=Rhodotorula paludigena TaxID=86838 RepID=UPI003178AD9B